MEAFHVIIAMIAIILVAHLIRFMAKENNQSDSSASNAITTRKKSKPMATPSGMPALRPAFAEETDWSKFDEPAYLRKQTSRSAETAEVSADSEKEMPVEAPSAKAVTQQRSRRRSSPKEQMEEFKKNVKNRRSEQSAAYEEI
ncbi:MAG: hypothetical protein GX771_07725 [Halomonadaceae bacterium]|nr:hypothetical protein [Halomonadaceae bacterium]